MGGGGALKKGGWVSKFAGFRGTFWFVEGYIFQGGSDFEEGKALFWHWIIPIYGPKCINFGAYAKYGHMVLGL